MSRTVIRVENLSKRYEIALTRSRADTLGEALMCGFTAPFSSVNGHRRKKEHVWALKDVSFEAKEGEVLGVIGRNGAGKSTLLKILSRVTEPTSGYAEISGRVGSLLEVGTGFHPELSGRDNIYLNGAILGMKKTEIDQKFDEIVAFAEIGKFIDTPVKRYSSGMYVRLAFAVAAHLESDILIVDEVLAVGDADFQKKCLGKMRDVSTAQGRTVLFVSHNTDAIQRLCSRCLMIEGGRLIVNDDTASVVRRYLSVHSEKTRPKQWIDLSQLSRTGTGEARFIAAQYSSTAETVGFQAYSNGPLDFFLAIESDIARSVGSLAVTLYSSSGTKLVNADTISMGRPVLLRRGHNLLRVRIKELHLNPGSYTAGFWLANPISSRRSEGEYDHIQSAFEIEVVGESSGRLGSRAQVDGVVACRFDVAEVAQEEGPSCWQAPGECISS